MSKKTQKLQAKLHKALTKYLRHIDDRKNHFSFSHLQGMLK